MSNLAKPNLRRRARVEINECGMAQSAFVFGDKWILLIMREAFYAVVRFEDIQKDLSIPRAILTNRLGRLIDLGIMTKQPYQEAGARVRHSYHLTLKGRKAFKILAAMMEWGDEYLIQNPKMQIVDGTTKSHLRLGLINELGQEVPQKQIALEPKR
ncbi:MAG: helix-turn-helix transcriptional regulator [Caulobacterales bacterium]|nr:helix-turn-helix transcriptional regulator [Caulobacterales bacterium]MCA0371959.1 helix-turn-helix transcriptional regulator [Pseudomonadota bacterium]